MPRFKPQVLRCCLVLILAGFAGSGRMATGAEETPPAPEQTLVERLVSAPDDAARDALLAAAKDPAPDMKAVRTGLGNAQQKALLGGDIAQAEILARYLETLGQRAGDDLAVYSARSRLADVHRLLGEFSQALEIQNAILEHFEHRPEVRFTVSALMGRGIVYIYQADYRRALENFQRALALSEANGYRDGAIPALNSTGEVFREQGEPARALEYYAKARTWLGDDTAWNNTFLFNNIAQSYLALGDRAQAIDYLRRAGDIAEKTGQKPRAATTLAVLGDVYRQEGKADEARACLERSLALSHEGRDAAGEGRAQLGLAELAGSANPDAALAEARQAANSYRTANQPAGLGAALTAVGHAERALRHRPEARAAFTEAIAVTEAVRGRLAGGDLEAQAYFEGKVSPYQELVALLADEPDGAEAALQAAERAKARVLLDIVRRDPSELEAVSLSGAERGREEELSRRLAACNHRVTLARGGDYGVAEAEQSLQLARTEWDQYQQDLLIAHPALARQRPPARPLSGEEAARLTEGGQTALLEFVVADDAAYLLVVATNPGGEKAPAVRLFPVAVSRAELARRAELLRDALAQRSLGWQEQARSLYDDLLQSSAAVWGNASRLVIVPDGPLWNLPFQVLQAREGACLWQKLAIGYAPSLTFLQAEATTVPPEREPRLLAMGNPSMGSVRAGQPAAPPGLRPELLAPLPEAETQVAALAKLYPANALCYTGMTAHEDTFKREASACDVLHLATHGILNDQNPLYSYLVMAQTDLPPDEDGLLEARELMGLRLHARLAVLSACETGRGRVGAGEGLLGLSWALFSAGCPAVVVSQWKVDSASTTELMIGFHRRLAAGEPPATALRAAGLELAQNPKYRHPFYWAPFVLVGASGPVAPKRP